MTINNKFYLQDSRSLTGTNVMFHRKNWCGYGTNLDELEVYTRNEAQADHDFRETDIPLLKSLVDELSILAVDHQVLPESDTIDPGDKYIIQLKGYWNGNDILFVGDGHTYNYRKAHVFSKNEADKYSSNSKYLTVFSKKSIDDIARRTFQAGNIDRRKMIFKPGIKLTKPKRKRPTTGKTRGNCPSCGQITWDYNPYEAAYCAKCKDAI